jgi:Tol biopolymer transport system component
MPSMRELIEREGARVHLEHGHFERLLRRRDRKRRNQRIGAGVVSLVVTLLTAAILARSFQRAPVPAIPPDPLPAALGALAYFVHGDVYVAEWNGANPVRIANGGPATQGCSEGYWADATVWSPDGRYLAFRHTTCQGDRISHDVVISDPEGNVLASFPSDGWDINWSLDSTRVAVWVDFPTTIGIYGPDGERQQLLSVPRGWLAPCDCDPAWSRDGASLLVPFGVVVPLDGTAPFRLPADDPRSQGGAYSPDGSHMSFDRDTYGSLVVAAADGSDARDVGGGGVDDGPIWSPTSELLAFTYSESRRNHRANEIRVFDVATGSETSVIGAGGTDLIRIIEFSPEGDRILFESTADQGRGATSLWSVDADGSHARRLVTGSESGDWQSLSGTT